MNIFVDLHHSGLMYSYHALFEKRLGYRVFRPIGLEWFERGFWDIAKPYNNDLGTVRQFLSMHDTGERDGSPPFNQIVGRNPFKPYYTIYDQYYDYHQKAITFSQFLDMDFDLIIGSIPDHWYTYKKLRDQFKPKTKMVAHMGNMFNEIQQAIQEGIVENLLASTIEFKLPKPINSVFYYQEQPIPDFESNITKSDKPKISSYAHVLPKPELFEQYKQALPDYEWRAYGATCPDGWMASITDLYKNMQQSSFVYHVKPGGDGFGLNWHSAYMNSRPIITNYSDYKDKLGGLLFEDSITGIDLEARSFEDNVRLIKEIINDSDRLNAMQLESKKRFDQLVNYDNEQKKIEEFLTYLL